ncbi:tripartite motif-containing protein [Anaeramoeba flamelloides]|uniref:Tripartite motif-containing protein n=1 Tax=Anaeramoeba flamelloides TaxID=1746091 RepID=A0ABQ8YUW1_9EUKA|nr:tripartite motif-containing protein [Anaeramoeba flamelloides]
MTISLPIQSKKENLEEDKTIWCDGCLADNQKVAAIIYCPDCGENQCEECSSVHKIRRYKNHVRTDPKPKTKDIFGTEKCPIHQNCKLNRYCKNCQKLICDKCSSEHSNHETISFDQPMDFYKELINKQKKFTQNHYQRINENFEQLNYSEKQIKAQKEKILKKISKFYSDQKKLFDLLEQNEKKLTNDFFEQICNDIKNEKQSINNSKSSIQKQINQFKDLEIKINESNTFQFFKLYSEMVLAKKIKENNQLICSSKFNKKNIISNNLKNNLQNWKLNLPYDLNKTQINMPSEILLADKLQVSILLKNQFDEILNAKEFNIKIEIIKKKSNEMITEITNFKKGNNQKLIGEYLFKKEGEYQILFSINDEKIPKFAFNLTVIDYLFLEESEILQKEKNANFNEILEKWTKEAGCNINLQRRFNSRTDGWKFQTFHQKCDQKGKSIILVKLKNKSLFGAFTAVDWDSQSGEKQSTGNKSFLFSLISLDPNFKQHLKMHIYLNKNSEIYCDSHSGPCFGNNSDLDLGYSGNRMNNNLTTRSNLGSTYKPPFDYVYRSNQSKNFLAGSSNNWDISQIEIFCEK